MRDSWEIQDREVVWRKSNDISLCIVLCIVFVSSVSYRKMDLEKMSEIYIQGSFQSNKTVLKMKMHPTFIVPFIVLFRLFVYSGIRWKILEILVVSGRCVGLTLYSHMLYCSISAVLLIVRYLTVWVQTNS